MFNLGCRSCLKKWTDYYVMKGYNAQAAKKMAEKLLKRVGKRLRKEGRYYEPMYFLERDQGIPVFYLGLSDLRRLLRLLGLYLLRLTFQTNWKATLFWRRWIGKSHNPDYTQACTQGTCVGSSAGCTRDGKACTTDPDCKGTCGISGACGCPSPLPNSSQVSGCSWTCDLVAGARCTRCFENLCESLCTAERCAAMGTCGYNCDPPYVWNGVACALPVRSTGNGLTWFTTRA